LVNWGGFSVDNFLRAKAEIVEIDQKISELEARKGDLLRFIEMGESLFGLPNPGPTAAFSLALKGINAGSSEPGRTIDTKESRVPPPSLPSDRPMQDNIIACAMYLVKLNGKPVPTREILNYALTRGINVTGQNHSTKVLTVSAILSRSKSPKFKSNQGLGWTIDVSE
jgi:hypothetical protein